MSEILLDVQGQPATPAAGTAFLFPDTLTKKWQTKNDAGVVDTLDGLENFSTANQTGFAADTYLAGSSIVIPTSLVRAGSTYRLKFDMVKTAAGVAAFTLNVRFGTAGTIADTSRLALAFAIGTAAIDTGFFELNLHFRSVGAAGVFTAVLRCTHHLAATGLITTGASGTGIILGTSAGFDTTVANSILGVSINGGGSFAGTNTLVQSEMDNI